MSNVKEIWKNIIGYEGLYEVSSLGRIKSLAKTRRSGANYNTIRKYPEKILSIKLNGNGYEQTTIFKDGFSKMVSIHRVVAEAFLITDDLTKDVNHKNGNKRCNYVENLEWVSKRENECHKQKTKQNSSKYVGVSFVSKTKKWRSQIFFNKRKQHLGFYDSEEQAYLKRRDFELKNNISNKYL
jgi:cyclophilin family peptidyl-prolyl cis-trans isomerase